MKKTEIKKTEIKRLRRKCFKVLIFLFSIFYSLFSVVNAKGPGTTSGIFLRQPLGVRSFGLGNTYTGIADNIEAMWFNPAGVAEIDDPVIAALFSKDISETNHGFIACAYPFKRFVGAFSLSTLQTEKIEINLRGFTPYSVRAESDYLSIFLLGVPLGKFFDLGGSAKFLSSTIAEKYTAKTVVFDEGLLFRGLELVALGELSAGVSLQNFGGKLKYDEKTEKIPSILRLGASIKKYSVKYGGVIAGYDFVKTDGSKTHQNLGIEWTSSEEWLTEPVNSFSIRTGYGFGYDIENVAFGCGFGIKKIQVDYGVQLTDLDTRHKFLITYSFSPDKIEKRIPEAPSIIMTTIYFSSFCVISQEAEGILESICKILKKNYEYRVEIAGHTDDTLQEEEAKKLSLKRAETVLNYFTKKRFPGHIFEILSYGSTKPLADSSTEQGKQKNNRVEVILRR